MGIKICEKGGEALEPLDTKKEKYTYIKGQGGNELPTPRLTFLGKR